MTFIDNALPGKPAPDIYLQAAHRIGLQPGDCVVVEDSMAGIHAGRAAGIGYIIALVHERRNLATNIRNGADQRIQNLSQINWHDDFQDKKKD